MPVTELVADDSYLPKADPYRDIDATTAYQRSCVSKEIDEMEAKKFSQWLQQLRLLVGRHRNLDGDVLELLCGSGRHYPLLQQLKRPVWLSDGSPDMLSAARQMHDVTQDNCIEAKLPAFPWTEHSQRFGLVCAHWLLYYLQDSACSEVLRRLPEILTPTGYFATTEPLTEGDQDYYGHPVVPKSEEQLTALLNGIPGLSINKVFHHEAYVVETDEGLIEMPPSITWLLQRASKSLEDPLTV